MQGCLGDQDIILQESRKKHAAGTVKQAAKGVSSSHDAETQAVMAPGPRLQNESSENNCFMNVMLQCLWHCTPFRDALLSLSWKVIQVCSKLPVMSLPCASSDDFVMLDSQSQQSAAVRQRGGMPKTTRQLGICQ